MIIKVISNGHNITIPLPVSVVMNRFTLSSIINKASSKLSSKYGQNINFSLTRKQAALLLRELRRAKRRLRGEPLIEVLSAGGEKVLIKL